MLGFVYNRLSALESQGVISEKVGNLLEKRQEFLKEYGEPNAAFVSTHTAALSKEAPVVVGVAGEVLYMCIASPRVDAYLMWNTFKNRVLRRIGAW